MAEKLIAVRLDDALLRVTRTYWDEASDAERQVVTECAVREDYEACAAVARKSLGGNDRG